MNFGQAVEELKKGKKLMRNGWNGKGMYVYLVNGTTVSKSDLRNEAKEHYTEDKSLITINSHIDMKASDGSIVVGWLASQTDILAEDWQIV